MSGSNIFSNLVVRPVRREELFRWNSYMQGVSLPWFKVDRGAIA